MVTLTDKIKRKCRKTDYNFSEKDILVIELLFNRYKGFSHLKDGQLLGEIIDKYFIFRENLEFMILD